MDELILIVLAVVCIAIGFLLDILIRAIRGLGSEGKKSGAPVASTPAALAEKLPSPIGESAGRVPAAQTTSPAQFGLVSVLHIWRDPQSQRIVLETRGKTARSPSELDQKQHELVQAVYKELGAWAGLPAKPVPLPTPSALAVHARIEDGSLEPAADGVAKPVRPSLNPIDMFSNALRADVRKPPARSDLSLAAQVDAVLQEKLQGSPLAKRGIRLLDGPDQGLLVQVGIEKYAGVEEVPDAGIRALIRESVTEWGRRNTLGK